MILLYIATTAAFLVFFGFSIIKSMHMFQLNSYKVPTHIRWLRKNSRSLIPGAVGAVVTALLLICGAGQILSLCVMTALFAVLAILGIVTDPTTEGVSDSEQAMTYNEPKAKG